MAHRRAGAYFPPQSEPGWTLLVLRAAFLDAVEEVCPAAIDEYRSLSLDEVEAWAQRYHLTADWVHDAARRGIRFAQHGHTAGPVPLTVFSSPDMPPPGTQATLSYTWGAYTGIEDPSTFRKRHMQAFTRMLDAQINEAVKRLDAREVAGELSRDGFIEARTLKNIKHAARWQTLGSHAAQREARAIRQTLARIGLTPRPGLV